RVLKYASYKLADRIRNRRWGCTKGVPEFSLVLFFTARTRIKNDTVNAFGCA
ncbi:MAG: hypothetical protein ACI836_000481, partial [Saprospiraceae bacterium]